MKQIAGFEVTSRMEMIAETYCRLEGSPFQSMPLTGDSERDIRRLKFYLRRKLFQLDAHLTEAHRLDEEVKHLRWKIDALQSELVAVQIITPKERKVRSASTEESLEKMLQAVINSGDSKALAEALKKGSMSSHSGGP